MYSYTLAVVITNDLEHQIIDRCKKKYDQLQWKEIIQVKLISLAKRQVFGHVIQTTKDVKSIGYKSVFIKKYNKPVFIKKYNKHNEIITYKPRSKFPAET